MRPGDRAWHAGARASRRLRFVTNPFCNSLDVADICRRIVPKMVLRRLVTTVHAHQPAMAFVDQIVISGANFLTGIILARWLSVRDFAAYSLLLLSANFLLSLHRSLAAEPMGVLGATETNGALRMRYRALARLTALAVAPGAVVLAAVCTFASVPPSVTAAIVPLLGFSALNELARRYLYVRQKAALALALDTLACGLPIVILAVVIAAKLPAQLLLSFVAASVGVTAAACIGYGLTRGRTRPGSLREVAAEHWRMGRWVFASQFVFLGSTQLSPFFINLYLNPDALASFAVASALVNVFNLVRMPLGVYLLPLAAQRLEREGSAGLRKFLLGNMLGYAGLAAFLSLGLALFSTELVRLVYGAKYQNAGWVLAGLLLWQAPSVMVAVLNVGCLAARAARWIFFANAVGAVAALTLGQWLIAVDGLSGVIWAVGLGTMAPLAIQSAGLMYELRRSTDRAN